LLLDNNLELSRVVVLKTDETALKTLAAGAPLLQKRWGKATSLLDFIFQKQVSDAYGAHPPRCVWGACAAR
jgi:hypothetical protein